MHYPRYRQALALNPNSSLAAIWQMNMAELLIRAGRLDEAEKAALKALDLTRLLPESANKTFGLAVTYHAMGHHDESDAAMQRLTNNHDMDVPHKLALAHASRGEIDQAFDRLDKAPCTTQVSDSALDVVQVEVHRLPFKKCFCRSLEITFSRFLKSLSW